MTEPIPIASSSLEAGNPLAGVRVVVTRPSHQARPLLRAFRRAGADVRSLPVLEVAPPEDPTPLLAAARRIAEFRWVVFSSANSVRALCQEAPGHRLPPGVRVAAVGPATARVIRRRGRQPDLVAQHPRAEGLAEELLALIEPGEPVLLPQAEDARAVLARALLRHGADLSVVTAYRKQMNPSAAEQARAIFGDGPLGWVTFTSPRIAGTFAQLFGARWGQRRPTLQAASIGPVTSARLRALGVQPIAEAREPGDLGLVAAVRRACAGS